MNEQVLLRELEFLHGFGFGAFLPQYPPVKKTHAAKGNRGMPRKTAHQQKKPINRYHGRTR